MAKLQARHLHIVDAETGEALDECPTCGEWARKYNGALSQIGQLRADKDAEARAHENWPVAHAIFRYWQDKTGHDQAEFTGDRFWIVEPHLTRAAKKGKDGAAMCRSAIRGLCASDFHMTKGYDEFWRPFKTSAASPHASQDALEKWMKLDPERDATPTISQQTLLDHAKEVAGRVLERARLIEADDDPVVCAHLLVEIDKLTYDWRMTPRRADR